MPERFLSLIVTMLPAFQKIEQRLDRETGRRFNAFSLFAMNELATTRILTFLLDPTEAHGQKDVFLRLFIQRFVPDWKHAFKHRTAQKKSTTEANEAIDVTISDGSYWLGIENKIFDAPEQGRQAARYLNALQAASHQGYCLVYLSPSGAPPSVYSLPEKEKASHGANLVCGSWTRFDSDDDQAATPNANIMDWLADCRNQCQADNVVWLIREFATYVDSVIAGKKESDMADTAIVGLAFDKQNLEAALRIGENFDEIRCDVARTLLRCVQESLKEWARQQGEDWEVVATWKGGSWIERPSAKWLPLLLRKRAWPAMVGVGIVAEKDRLSEVFIGIGGPTQKTWKDDKNSIPYYGEQNTFIGEESRKRITSAIQMARQSPWWVQYGHLRDADGRNISDWRDITTVTRLYSEMDAMCKHIVGQMVEPAAKMGNLVIDAT